MTIDSEDQLVALQLVGKIVADCLQYMLKSIEAGMSTADLDLIGGEFLASHGAQSAPRLTYGFPGWTCISLNEEAAHGLPSEHRKIRKGDLVNIDVSAELNGFFADTGASYLFENNDPKLGNLCRSTKRALYAAIDSVAAGQKLNCIGKAIEKVARKTGHTIIENLCSHGVGGALHEAPEAIPSVYNPRDRRVIHEGLVFTIEPFLSTGNRIARETSDGWTLTNPKNQFSAQYEHSLVATSRGAIVLTQPTKGLAFHPG